MAGVVDDEGTLDCGGGIGLLRDPGTLTFTTRFERPDFFARNVTPFSIDRERD